MLSEGRVGTQTLSDGSQKELRMNKTGSQVCVGGGTGMGEPASRGTMYSAATAVGGVAPGTALSTTPPFVLWNPPSSNKNLVLHRVSLGYVSGTLGAGSLVLAQSKAQGSAPTTGSELSVQNNFIGGAAGVGRVFQGSTITTAPTILRSLIVMGAFVGGANNIGPIECLVDGAYVVPPGTLIAIQGVAAAGSSPLTIIAAEWEEIPV